MSALTSLLVRDDVVSVRQIEDALQRQVLEGGELDTALLELVDLPENVLIAYRAASFRAMPVARDELMSASSATQSLLDAELADAFDVVPIGHNATTLVLATGAPLSETQVAALVAKIGLRVEWRITSELRISAALSQFYGIAASPRLRELRAKVDAYDAGDLPVVAPLQVTPPIVMSPDMMEGFDESEDFEAALEAAFDRVSASPGRRTTGPLAGRILEVPPPPEKAAKKSAPVSPKSNPAKRRVLSPIPRSAAVSGKPAVPNVVKSKRAPKLGQARIPKGPLTDAQAAEVLENADERDTVVEVFFRYARQYFDTTVLFAVRDDRALGLEAYNASNLADVREVSVTFARGSALDDLVRSLLPRVVDLSRKDEDRPFALAMGRLDAQPSALIPVCIKRRVVSFVYGDRSGEPFQIDDLSALVGLLPHVSRAFERIIRTRKALAVHTHRSVRASQDLSLGLGHAPTQRSVAAPPSAAAIAAEAVAKTMVETLAADGGLLNAANANAGTREADSALALADARTKQALTSLGVPRTPPPPPAPRARPRSPAKPRPAVAPPPRAVPLDQVDTRQVSADAHVAAPLREATAMSPALNQATSADAPRPSKPPTPYFSKPPPGTGRYSSQRDVTHDEAPKRNVGSHPAHADASKKADAARDEAKPGAASIGEDTQPVRRARASGAARAARPSDGAASNERHERSRSNRPAPDEARTARTSRPPPAEARTARTSRPPAGAAHAAGHAEGKSRSPARSSKPPPGAGSYRSQGFTTELISVPKTSDAGAVARESFRPPVQNEEAFGAQRSPLLPGTAGGRAAAAVKQEYAPPQPSAAEAKEAAAQADQRHQVALLLAELRDARPEDDGQLIQQLLRFGDEALDALSAQFPGPLWFDRRRPHARVPLGRDISAIARAMVAFGDRAYARFPGLLRAQSGEVRYYATLFVSDRVYPPLLEPLIERLFDDDPQIRLIVRDTLPHYRRVAGFSKVTERLRSQAADAAAPLKARLAALDAISVLRDAQSVPILIELINHSDKQISVPSQRALVAITCQDFAKSVKKWRAWYQDNAARHRVEWLIDALMHSDQALRGAAGLELQKITQVYYGYVAAAAKREREQAQRRYWDWWQSEGRSKF